jgi:hypothetical protein
MNSFKTRSIPRNSIEEILSYSKLLSAPAVATIPHPQLQTFWIKTAGHGCVWKPTLLRRFKQTLLLQTHGPFIYSPLTHIFPLKKYL